MLKKTILFLVIGINLWGLWLPTASAVLVIAVSAVLLFASEALPTTSSSFVLLLLLALRTYRDDQTLAFVGFHSSIIFFLISVTGIGLAVARSGLGQWFVARVERLMQGTRLPLPVLLCISFFPLSFVLPSSMTRNAMLQPLMVDLLDRNQAQAETRRVGLTLGMLNPLASSALLTGGLAPMVTASLLGGFSWGRWFSLMLLPYYLLLAAGLGYLLWRYPVKRSGRPIISSGSRMLQKDYFLLLILALTVGLWVTDSWHHLPSVIPALLSFSLLLSFGYLRWDDLKQTSMWDTVIVLGMLLSLTEALRRYGALTALTATVSQVLPAALPKPILLLLIMLCTIICNLLIPNITICLTILIPLFTQLAGSLGLNPILVGLMITMTVDSVKFYPSQSTGLLMVYNGKDFSIKDVAQMGLFMTLALATLLLICFVPYWHLFGVGI